MIQKSIKLILFLETIKNYNIQINRYSSGGPGGKKLGEKLAEKGGENLSKTSSLPNIKPLSTENPNKNLPKYTKTQENKNTKSPEKKSIPPEIKNKIPPKIISSNNTDTNTSPFPKLSIKGKQPQGIVKKEVASDEIKIIAVNLKTENEEEKKTPEAKHICLGEKQEDDRIVISSYLTSSAAYSPEKYNHGQPQNIRISNTKADKSYIPEKEKVRGSDDQGNAIIYKREIRLPANDNEDGGGMAIPSEIKGGQFIRKFKKEKTIEKGGYIENKEATDYIQKDKDIYKNVKNIHREVTKKNMENSDNFTQNSNIEINQYLNTEIKTKEDTDE
jgi:hypothetical protein